MWGVYWLLWCTVYIYIYIYIYTYNTFDKSKNVLALLAGGAEYTNCTSVDEWDLSIEGFGYETNSSEGKSPALQIWRVWSTFSLRLISVTPCPGVEVLVNVSYIRQIDIFNHLLNINNITVKKVTDIELIYSV